MSNTTPHQRSITIARRILANYQPTNGQVLALAKDFEEWATKQVVAHLLTRKNSHVSPLAR